MRNLQVICRVRAARRNSGELRPLACANVRYRLAANAHGVDEVRELPGARAHYATLFAEVEAYVARKLDLAARGELAGEIGHRAQHARRAESARE
jgi:hypothetical protein